MALPFARSGGAAGFAVDKAAGVPCTHLRDDFGCRIHDRLRGSGFPGCTVYDCFGAGQKVSRVTFEGHSWRERPQTADAMYGAFAVMRQLHELLRHCAEALELPEAGPVRQALETAYEQVDTLTRTGPEALLALDTAAVRDDVNAVLLRAGEHVRARRAPGRRKNHRGADLMGARLRGAGLRGACLRGALLTAADLTGADLYAADLLGADLRDTRLHGADLTAALFLTRPQLAAAHGDRTTRLPTHLARPAHW